MGTIGYFYSNTAIPASIGNSGGLGLADTSLFCQSLPEGYPGQFPFKLRLDPGTGLEEVVKVTAGNGTPASPWTITRAWDNTLASPHAEGATIKHGITAEDLALAREHEAADNITSDPSQPGDTFPHGLPAAAWLSGSFSALNEQALTTAVTQINFAAIPQSYKHLLLVLNGRLDGTSSQPGYAQATVNGDGTASYGEIGFGADTLTGGTLVNPPKSSQTSAQSSWAKFIELPSSQTGSSVNAGGGFAFFMNYTSNTFSKTVIVAAGFGFGTAVSATGQIRWCSYNPATPASITSIALASSQGNFVAGTLATLYGIG